MADLLSTPRNQFVNVKQSQITCKHVNRNFFCTLRQVRYHRNCIADIDSPMTPITDIKKKKKETKVDQRVHLAVLKSGSKK